MYMHAVHGVCGLLVAKTAACRCDSILHHSAQPMAAIASLSIDHLAAATECCEMQPYCAWGWWRERDDRFLLFCCCPPRSLHPFVVLHPGTYPSSTYPPDTHGVLAMPEASGTRASLKPSSELAWGMAKQEQRHGGGVLGSRSTHG